MVNAKSFSKKERYNENLHLKSVSNTSPRMETQKSVIHLDTNAGQPSIQYRKGDVSRDRKKANLLQIIPEDWKN